MRPDTWVLSEHNWRERGSTELGSDRDGTLTTKLWPRLPVQKCVLWESPYQSHEVKTETEMKEECWPYLSAVGGEEEYTLAFHSGQASVGTGTTGYRSWVCAKGTVTLGGRVSRNPDVTRCERKDKREKEVHTKRDGLEMGAAGERTAARASAGSSGKFHS